MLFCSSRFSWRCAKSSSRRANFSEAGVWAKTADSSSDQTWLVKWPSSWAWRFSISLLLWRRRSSKLFWKRSKIPVPKIFFKIWVLVLESSFKKRLKSFCGRRIICLNCSALRPKICSIWSLTSLILSPSFSISWPPILSTMTREAVAFCMVVPPPRLALSCWRTRSMR